MISNLVESSGIKSHSQAKSIFSLANRFLENLLDDLLELTVDLNFFGTLSGISISLSFTDVSIDALADQGVNILASLSEVKVLSGLQSIVYRVIVFFQMIVHLVRL